MHQKYFGGHQEAPGSPRQGWARLDAGMLFRGGPKWGGEQEVFQGSPHPRKAGGSIAPCLMWHSRNLSPRSSPTPQLLLPWCLTQQKSQRRVWGPAYHLRSTRRFGGDTPHFTPPARAGHSLWVDQDLPCWDTPARSPVLLRLGSQRQHSSSPQQKGC